jgi:hypothetical protein
MGVMNGARTQHRYQTWPDESCERFACRVWKEGFREGYERGYAEGEAAGRATGFAEGYAAGAAAVGKE